MIDNTKVIPPNKRLKSGLSSCVEFQAIADTIKANNMIKYLLNKISIAQVSQGEIYQ